MHARPSIKEHTTNQDKIWQNSGLTQNKAVELALAAFRFDNISLEVVINCITSRKFCLSFIKYQHVYRLLNINMFIVY